MEEYCSGENTKNKELPLPISQEIVTEKIEKYESLIKQLRAEILKLRTYPIPEPWGSHCMREELTYVLNLRLLFKLVKILLLQLVKSCRLLFNLVIFNNGLEQT